jgi:hypothetical protein
MTKRAVSKMGKLIRWATGRSLHGLDLSTGRSKQFFATRDSAALEGNHWRIDPRADATLTHIRPEQLQHGQWLARNKIRQDVSTGRLQSSFIKYPHNYPGRLPDSSSNSMRRS